MNCLGVTAKRVQAFETYFSDMVCDVFKFEGSFPGWAGFFLWVFFSVYCMPEFRAVGVCSKVNCYVVAVR